MRNFRGFTSYRSAFTLAEVLITIGIIGVVAAMTMPTLMAKYQEKVTVTKLKKVYSILSQAYLRAQEDYGTIDNWGFPEDSGSTTDPDTGETVSKDENAKNTQILWETLSKYMNVSYKCYQTDDTKCINNALPTHGLGGNTMGSSKGAKQSIIKLSDGTTFSGGWIDFSHSGTCNDKKSGYCGNFIVDLNGLENAPNTIGKDMFAFKLTRVGIYPHGGPDEVRNIHKFPRACDRNSTGSNSGFACAAWVIYNENMDYLHCDDLSWGGKHKCK